MCTDRVKIQSKTDTVSHCQVVIFLFFFIPICLSHKLAVSSTSSSVTLIWMRYANNAKRPFQAKWNVKFFFPYQRMTQMIMLFLTMSCISFAIHWIQKVFISLHFSPASITHYGSTPPLYSLQNCLCTSSRWRCVFERTPNTTIGNYCQKYSPSDHLISYWRIF